MKSHFMTYCFDKSEFIHVRIHVPANDDNLYVVVILDLDIKICSFGGKCNFYMNSNLWVPKLMLKCTSCKGRQTEQLAITVQC